MGREQNTSPSRGSGYQVINDLFDRQQDFIVVGLCGKTGSGVSTTAEILNKEFVSVILAVLGIALLFTPMPIGGIVFLLLALLWKSVLSNEHRRKFWNVLYIESWNARI